MKNFKAVITTNKDEKVGRHQRKIVVKFSIPLKLEIDKNNNICDMQPRIFNNIDLFSKYHGRVNYYGILNDMEILINGQTI